MNQDKTRANPGGQIGANGEFYKGGQFIARTDRPKGQPVRHKKTGKREIEPFVWVLPPVEGAQAIFPRLSGRHPWNRDTKTFGFNEEFIEDLGPIDGARERQLINLFNSGERWT